MGSNKVIQLWFELSLIQLSLFYQSCRRAVVPIKRKTLGKKVHRSVSDPWLEFNTYSFNLNDMRQQFLTQNCIYLACSIFWMPC